MSDDEILRRAVDHGEWRIDSFPVLVAEVKRLRGLLAEYERDAEDARLDEAMHGLSEAFKDAFGMWRAAVNPIVLRNAIVAIGQCRASVGRWKGEAARINAAMTEALEQATRPVRD